MKHAFVRTDASIRASPRYALIDADQVPAARRARLRHVREGDRLLQPSDPEGEWRVVGPATAALFRSLAHPRAAPDLGALLDDDRLVPRLILDGVLEVEVDGRFVGGPGAYPALVFPPDATPRPDDRTGELSEEALAYGEALRLEDTGALARRLYGYNTFPLTPDHMSRLRAPESVREFIATAAHEPVSRAGPRRDRAVRSSENDAWLSWHASDGAPDGSPVFKLYVSPTLRHLPHAFRIVADRFAGGGPFAFKVGASLAGLLRPDKLVVYFTSRDELMDFAAALRPPCEGMAAQGVPFTGGLSGDGLLSWGMDPPKSGDGTWWGGESWRVWLTALLARALVSARRAGLDGPAEFARARIALEGIDLATWAPRERT